MGPTHDTKTVAHWRHIVEHGDAKRLCILLEKLHFQSEVRCPKIVPPLVARIVKNDEAICCMDMTHRVSLQLFLDRHAADAMLAYMSFLAHDPRAETFLTALRALTQMALRAGLPNQEAFDVVMSSLHKARKAHGEDTQAFDQDISALKEMSKWRHQRVGAQILSYDRRGRLRRIYDEQSGSRSELIYTGRSGSFARVTGHSCIQFSNCEHDPFDGLDFGGGEFRRGAKKRDSMKPSMKPSRCLPPASSKEKR